MSAETFLNGISRAKLAHLTQPDPNQPPVINLEIDGRFIQAQLSESQRRNLTVDAARYAPLEEDETAALEAAVASLEAVA